MWNKDFFFWIDVTLKRFLCVQTCEQRQVSHFQYLSWPDYGVPTSAVTLIDFLGAVKRQQRKMVRAVSSQWMGHPLGPPMVVHCSAGIGRTGKIVVFLFYSFSVLFSSGSHVGWRRFATFKCIRNHGC